MGVWDPVVFDVSNQYAQPYLKATELCVNNGQRFVSHQIVNNIQQQLVHQGHDLPECHIVLISMYKLHA